VPFGQVDVVSIPAGVVVSGVAADVAKIVLHDFSKPEVGNTDVDASMQQHDAPHAQVVRTTQWVLQFSAEATSTLTDAQNAQLRSALGSLVALTRQKLELKGRQFGEVKEDERRALETALLSLVGERIARLHAHNIYAGPVELQRLKIEVRGRNRVPPAALVQRVRLRSALRMSTSCAHDLHRSSQRTVHAAAAFRREHM
jgi:hypothetical protein